MNAKHLVINYIEVDNELVLVGATDNERWRWDTEDGMSGADAKTIVWVTLNGLLKSHIAICEEATFHCYPGDPVRRIAMEHISELFDIAWKIRNEYLNEKAAKEIYWGFEIK
jgi:hypothetical protein